MVATLAPGTRVTFTPPTPREPDYGSLSATDKIIRVNTELARRTHIGMSGKPSARSTIPGTRTGSGGVRRESGPCGAGVAQLANVVAA